MAHRPVLINNRPSRISRPIIEIIGPVDSGKVAVARLLARRIHGNHLALPTLNPLSPAGRALFELITKEPTRIERDPVWWAHLYAAMLMENREKIELLQQAGPLVVTNYLTSFRIWSKASGVRSPLQDWTPGIPEPDCLFTIEGDPYKWPGNVPANYSSELLSEVSRRIGSIQRSRSPRIRVDGPEKFVYSSLNRAAEEIGAHLHSKYGLVSDEAFVYTKENYPQPRKAK